MDADEAAEVESVMAVLLSSSRLTERERLTAYNLRRPLYEALTGDVLPPFSDYNS